MSELDGMAQELLQAGLKACRQGDWRGGLNILDRLSRIEGITLPGVFYANLGVAMARCQGRKHEGVELCRHGVKLSPRDPECRLNLARAYLIAHNRRQAIRQMYVGLKMRPSDPRLREFKKEIGTRRPPPLRFLDRSNPFNFWLGRITYGFQKRKAERREFEKEEAEFRRLMREDDELSRVLSEHEAGSQADIID